MSEKINHWCVVCGKGYHACDTCDKMKSFTPWRKMADTPEHYKIFLLVKEYKNKFINKLEAKKMLSNIDISDIGDLKEDVRAILDEILTSDATSDKPKKSPTSNNIKRNTDVDNTVTTDR